MAEPPGMPPAFDPVSREERTMALLCHVLGLTQVVVQFPGSGVLAPMILWMIKKDEMPFVDDQGKEAMNFQLTIIIAVVAAILLSVVTCGLLIPVTIILLVATYIGSIVFVIIAAVQANEGVAYRYPICLRLIK